MVKIKKVKVDGATVYPATIMQAVKDPSDGKHMGEKLADLASILLEFYKGYGLTSEGLVVESTNEYYTDYIELTSQSKVSCLYDSDSWSGAIVSLYDENKAVILVKELNPNNKKYEAVIPSNCKYICCSTRVVEATSVVVSASLNNFSTKTSLKKEFEGVYKKQIIDEEFNKRDNQINNLIEGNYRTLEFYKGYGLTSGGALVESVNEYYTDYIELVGNSKVSCLYNSDSWSGAIVGLYDEGKNVITVKELNPNNKKYEAVIPSNCKYICCSTRVVEATQISVEVIDVYERKVLDIIDNKLVDHTTEFLYNIAQGLSLDSIDDSNPPAIDTEDSEWDWQNCFIGSNGGRVYYTNEITTRMLACLPNSSYVYYGDLQGTASICFYDENRIFISGKSANEFGKVTNIPFVTPNNCFYIKATCTKSKIESSFKILYKGTKRLKEGLFPGYEGTSVLKKINGIASWQKEKVSNSSQSRFFCNMSPKNIELLNGEILRSSEDYRMSQASIPVKIESEATIRLKVKFPEDLHTGSVGGDIFRLKNSNGEGYFRVVKSITTFRNNDGNINCLPVPNYNAGLRTSCTGAINYLEVRPDGFEKELLLGCDAMAIRFSGDCNNVSNQDICIEITDSVCRIFHLFANSTIAEYSFGSYPSVKDLYGKIEDDIKSGILSDFEVKMLNIDNLMCTDIIPCRVHLVTQYYKNAEKTVMAWDAFPYYFTTKEKGRIYTIELLLDKNCSEKSQLLIDGYGVRFGNVNTDIFFDAESVLTINSSEDIGISIMSVEVVNKAQSIFPLAKVLYAEGVYEGLNQDSVQNVSEEILSGAFQMFADNNYKHVGFDNISNLAKGFYGQSNKIIHMSHDDHAINVLTNKNIRELYLRYGAKPSFGMILSQSLSDDDKKHVRAAKSSGFDFVIHQPRTNPYSGIGYFSYDELKGSVQEAIDVFVDEYGFYPTCWDYHTETENYNTSRFLKNCGFTLIFGATGRGGVNAINKYRCMRMTVRDKNNYPNISKFIDNYICAESWRNLDDM